MAKKSIIVCVPEKNGDYKGRYETCSECSMEIFLCDSSLNSVIQNGCSSDEIVLLCFDCAKPMLSKPKSYQLMSVTREQEIECNSNGFSAKTAEEILKKMGKF